MQANGIYKTIFLRSLTALADRLGSARFIQFLDRDRRAAFRPLGSQTR